MLCVCTKYLYKKKLCKENTFNKTLNKITCGNLIIFSVYYNLSLKKAVQNLLCTILIHGDPTAVCVI